MSIKVFEDFIRYNANDRGKNVGDCVKRALSLAFDIPYNEVQKELSQIAKDINGTGYKLYNYHHDIVFNRFIKNRGKSWVTYEYEQSQPTLDEFAKEHSDGSYLILTGNPKRGVEGGSTHMVAVVDGDIYDSWDSSNQLVKSVCTVKEEKQNRKQDLNFKEICEELCNNGSEVVRDIIMSSRFYKNHNFPDDLSCNTSCRGSVSSGTIVWYINFQLTQSGYKKQYKITYTINPTHSKEQNIKEAWEKVQIKTKQCLYNFSQILKKLISYNVDDDVDTNYSPRYSDESKVFNRLPFWVRKRVLYIDISTDWYDSRSKSYEVKIVPLPGDPRVGKEDDENAVRIPGDNMQDLLDNLDAYKDSYARFGYDY